MKLIKLLSLAVMMLLFITESFAQAPTLTLHLDKPGAAVSPMLYGLMTEEINHSYDGGTICRTYSQQDF